jgi:hypothetical protein
MIYQLIVQESRKNSETQKNTKTIFSRIGKEAQQTLSKSRVSSKMVVNLRGALDGARFGARGLWGRKER